MKVTGFRRFGVFLLFLFCLFLSSGCQKNASSSEETAKPPQSYSPGKTSVLVPDAPGTVTTGGDPLILDFSNANHGYFMGKLTQPNTKVNIQITGPDDVCYKYFLTQSLSSIYTFLFHNFLLFNELINLYYPAGTHHSVI